jgi:hypothetical protein
MDSATPREMISAVQDAVASVRPEVLTRRLRDALNADFAVTLRHSTVRIVYLLSGSDRLLGTRGLRGFLAARPDVETVKIDGPHFLSDDEREDSRDGKCWGGYGGHAPSRQFCATTEWANSTSLIPLSAQYHKSAVASGLAMQATCIPCSAVVPSPFRNSFHSTTISWTALALGSLSPSILHASCTCSCASAAWCGDSIDPERKNMHGASFAWVPSTDEAFWFYATL